MKPDNVVLVREAALVNVDDVVEIAYETKSTQSVEPNMSLDQLRSIYLSFFETRQKGNSKLYVAAIDNKIAGFLSVAVGKNQAHLGCGVRSVNTRNGVAKKLVLFAVNAFRESAVKEFVAVTRADNLAARRTLVSCDFILQGPWSKDPTNFLEFTRSRL